MWYSCNYCHILWHFYTKQIFSNPKCFFQNELLAASQDLEKEKLDTNLKYSLNVVLSPFSKDDYGIVWLNEIILKRNIWNRMMVEIKIRS